MSQIKKGVSASQIIVGGFSQGGALAYAHCMRSSVKLGGCCVIATWVPLREDYPKSLGTAATSIPTWQGHGDSDNMVDDSVGKRAVEFLKSLGISAEFELFSNLGHNTCPKQIASAAKFIKKCLTCVYIA